MSTATLGNAGNSVTDLKGPSQFKSSMTAPEMIGNPANQERTQEDLQLEQH